MKAFFKVATVFLTIATSTVLTKALAAESVQKTTNQSVELVGTWRLVSWIEEETEGAAAQVYKNFGDNPLGFVTYTPDGHMMVIFADPARKAAASPKATDAEAAQLYRTMVAYTGTYTVEGDKITYKVDVSWNQAWNGTTLQRTIDITGDRLTTKSLPFVSPFLGKQIVATLIWERVK